MIDTPCVLFAGGKSSRMGEDKALLPFGEFTTLTEFQYSRLSNIFTNVYISCKDKSKFSFEADFIEEKCEDIYAPTIGFLAAFEQLESEKFFALSVDAPFVDEAVIKALFLEDKESLNATIAKTDRGMQPLCGIYHRSLEPEFKTMLSSDQHKLGSLLKNANTHFVFFENDLAFTNLNNKEEYQKSLSLLK